MFDSFQLVLSKAFLSFFAQVNIEVTRGHQRSPKVRFAGLSYYFYQECAIISDSIIGSRMQKKTLESPFKAISLTCHQN